MKLFHKKLLSLSSSVLMVLFLGACSESANTNIDNIGPGKERVEVEVEQFEGDHFELLQQASEEYLKNVTIESVLPNDVYNKFIFGSEEEFLIVDVRDVEAFAIGNIEGSVNIPYANTADANYLQDLPKDKKLIVVCFSGHTAAQTVALWSMLGYDAVTMEYGMGGWSTADGLGAPFIKQPFDFEVVNNPVQETGSYELPTLETETVANFSELILAQSKEYLSSGKSAVIPAPTVMEKVQEEADDVFLLDIRQENHYQNGHVQTALNIPVETLANKENLAKLPLDKQIIIIGYNATDASVANRVLNQLGYNAVAMHSGMRVWTSDTAVTGTGSIPVGSLGKLPVANLNFNLSGEAAAAG
ncbi:rhodanese-like domain-containing protein [Bacillaceae bacterium IKA-2]|nr:rhodanese-like domain-containing protein [Bacillaceae bacterium IKA-2]